LLHRVDLFLLFLGWRLGQGSRSDYVFTGESYGSLARRRTHLAARLKDVAKSERRAYVFSQIPGKRYMESRLAAGLAVVLHGRKSCPP
jgi:hypothetical protein